VRASRKKINIRLTSIQEIFLPEVVIPQASALGLEGTAFKFEKSVKKSTSVTALIDQSVGTGQQPPEKMADVGKAILGVNVHRVFENLQYLWLNNPDLGIQEIIDQTVEEFRAPLKYLAYDNDGKWLELIKYGLVEYGVSVEDEGRFIQGQIDLWGVDQQGTAWIVDYKTGSDLYMEKAFRQLEIYKWCLLKMKKISEQQNVKLVVIYPYSQKTFVREPVGTF
jgi:ATP-dependent helicase/nuclease subunit A